MAALARTCIGSQAMQRVPVPGDEAHFWLTVQAQDGTGEGRLAVRLRLNAQSKYDLTGIDWHNPSTGQTLRVNLPAASAGPAAISAAVRAGSEGRMVSRGTLRMRQYNQRQVPDPERPGQMILQRALYDRKYNRQ